MKNEYMVTRNVHHRKDSNLMQVVCIRDSQLKRVSSVKFL